MTKEKLTQAVLDSMTETSGRPRRRTVSKKSGRRWPESPVVAAYLELHQEAAGFGGKSWHGQGRTAKPKIPFYLRKHIRGTIVSGAFSVDEWKVLLAWIFEHWSILCAENTGFPEVPTLNLVYGWRKTWFKKACSADIEPAWGSNPGHASRPATQTAEILEL